MINLRLFNNFTWVLSGWRVSVKDGIEFVEGNSSTYDKPKSLQKWIDQDSNANGLIHFGEENGPEDHTGPVQDVDKRDKELEFVDAVEIWVHNKFF